MRVRSSLALLALLAGCGGSSGPPDEVLAELDALARGPNRMVAIASALVASGSLFVPAPDDTLLTEIDARLGTETSGCATRATVDGTISVDLHTAAGDPCVLQTGVVSLAGTMTIKIARADPTIRIITMMDVTVDGEPLKGELAIATTDGNVFSYTVLASLAGHEFDLRSFSAVPNGLAAVVGTSATTPGVGEAVRTLTYTNVAQRFSACHAHAGSLQLTSTMEGLDRTLTFADVTPQTGAAFYSEGSTTASVTLPHLPSCPPLPQGS